MAGPTEELRELGFVHDVVNGKNGSLAITLQCVAVGSMVVLATAKAAHLAKDLFGHTDHHGRSR